LTTGCYCGQEALAQMRNPQFRESWSRLFEVCPWGTIHQRVEFAEIWYDAYRTVFEPLFITQEDENCELSGLLALSRSQTGQIIRELSAGVRKSETVTLRDPVMPVTDGFSG
jgi:hypothetical protein